MEYNNKEEIFNIAQKQVDYVKSILGKRFVFEDNNTNEVQGGYTTYGTLTTPSSIVVVRISNHVCAMENWTERYKKRLIPNKKLARRMGSNLQEPYKYRYFYSIVFKAFDYNPNDSGAWNAECFEYVFNPIEVKNENKIDSVARDAFGLSGQKTLIAGLSPITRKAITSKPNPTTIENCNPKETNENRNTGEKQIIRLNESEFKNLVKESVKRVLKSLFT